ncbi:hypothetical protein B0T20DRAFT_475427 [Sordaria brevicollis]|uniref:2EXR domain-containing protein n=1 Tax=Sordaria brevicollis TaxID=83679 RepID=A0AAE0UFB6_SORBR|nr:hypothetical protein B0T20DRAFT_475427 [Sordaria brevicollis]
MATAITFHPFPRLPAEIRLMNWEFSILPRTLNVRGRPDPSNSDPTQQAEREASLSASELQFVHRRYPFARSNSIHSGFFIDRLPIWNPPLPVGPPPPQR